SATWCLCARQSTPRGGQRGNIIAFQPDHAQELHPHSMLESTDVTRLLWLLRWLLIGSLLLLGLFLRPEFAQTLPLSACLLLLIVNATHRQLVRALAMPTCILLLLCVDLLALGIGLAVSG